MKMRHLCAVCSTLYVGESEIPSVDASGVTNVHELKSLAEPAYSSTAYLISSAEGKADGKACHLCALLLRSLKNHQKIGTNEEETSLPPGAIKLSLQEEGGNISIVASCGSRDGHPVQLSIGGG